MKIKALKYLSFILFCCAAMILLSPKVEFRQPYSKILYDKDGGLLGGKIATDGQWRFPELDSVPEYYERAFLTFEDKRFKEHIGVDFLALLRAFKQNIKEKRIVSGASTVTMQVCRMSRGNKPRTVTQKLIEICMAIKLELISTKQEILALHASHAPFGGNVVGLEAASWRYFGKSPEDLGLSEAALLAVLPNAPALMHPGKNRSALTAKRDRLLKRMMDENQISQLDYELAVLEQIPEKPQALPRLAPHLLEYAFKYETNEAKYISTIDRQIQNSVRRTAELFSEEYQQSDIQNLGILVLDTWTGETLAYVGNSPNAKEEEAVDMIQAPRSSGSVLKPLLHAYALDDGLISPKGLVMDVPVDYDGYSPRNYNKKYLGAVHADIALAMSLNVPAVKLLQEYKVSRFLQQLRKQKISTVNQSADFYGLSLILGGGEVTLWDLTGAYASLSRVLDRYNKERGRYTPFDFHSASITKKDKPQKSYSRIPDVVSAAAVHHTFSAMQKVSRPDEEGNWQAFHSVRNISWKTGTSFGHRDAWAVGVSPRYTVGVWVGNADGEGKHGLIGVKKAAPVLFDVFNQLDDPGTFQVPKSDLTETIVCTETGFAANKNCTHRDTIYQIASASKLRCNYHHSISLDDNGNRVNSLCESISSTHQESYLILPADAAYYYRKYHPEYKSLPHYRSDCRTDRTKNVMQFIYPKPDAKIFLPIDGDGQQEVAVFQVVHQEPKAKLYWHLNEKYLGMTEDEHRMTIDGDAGEHQILLIDEEGNRLNQEFEIIGVD